MAGGLVALAALCGPATASATTLLIDFSDNNNAGTGGSTGNGTGLSGNGPGGTWNILANPATTNFGNLADSTGAATTITLTRSGTVSESGNTGTALTFNNSSGEPSWAVTSTDNRAAGDIFFTSNGDALDANTFMTFTFGGLSAGQIFSCDLLSSRATTTSLGFYEYSLDGGINWTGFTVLEGNGTPSTSDGWDTQTSGSQIFRSQEDGYTAHRYMNASNVTLTGSTLAVRALEPPNQTGGNKFAVLNAARLTVTAVPEPSTLGLLALGLLGFGSHRRRSARQPAFSGVLP